MFAALSRPRGEVRSLRRTVERAAARSGNSRGYSTAQALGEAGTVTRSRVQVRGGGINAR